MSVAHDFYPRPTEFLDVDIIYNIHSQETMEDEKSEDCLGIWQDVSSLIRQAKNSSEFSTSFVKYMLSKCAGNIKMELYFPTEVMIDYGMDDWDERLVFYFISEDAKWRYFNKIRNAFLIADTLIVSEEL